MRDFSPTLVVRRLALALALVASGLLAVPGSGLSATTTLARPANPNPVKAKSPAKRPAAKPEPGPLLGWLASGARFPNRALVLSAPVGTLLSAGQIRVAENGAPVASLALTPVAQARAGDFGVMLVVDQSSSMAGAPDAAVTAAVRGFAARRVAKQELGLIGFDVTSTLILAPSSDQNTIDSALAQNSGTGASADVPGATSLALTQLAKANVALGAVVVISDGVRVLTPAGGPSVASVQSAAAAAHVPIFTVGLQDVGSSPASLTALQAASPGQFEASTEAGLSRALQSITGALSRGYIVRYRSQQGGGRHVMVTATAQRVSGTVDVSYQAPVAAPAVKPASGGSAGRPSSGLSVSGATLLSAWPSFAPGGVPAPAPLQTTQAHAVPLALVAGVFGLLVALAVMLAVRHPARAVQERVFNFIPGEEPGYLDPVAAAEERHGFTHLLERGNWWSPFVENVEIARIKSAPIGLVKRAAATAAVVAVLVGVVSGSPLLGLLPMLFWPIALRMFVKRAARKQRELFINSLPAYLQDLASALRVGRSFAGALAVVAATADEPVRSELERAIADESLGRPLEDSLAAVAVRMQATDMEQVALVAALNTRSGSNVAEALDRVADGARERGDLRREIKGLVGQAKMSSSVLTGLPPIVLLFMSFISPAYAHPLFHTTIGIAMLVISTLMVMAGWKVMKKISMVKA